MAVLLALALPATGLAQQADAPALLREGFAARRAQRDADALRAFSAAWALDRAPSTLAQVALAEQALGRWVDAERHLAECLAADDRWIARHAPALRSALAVMRGHLATLTLEGRPAGATVLIDGRPVGALPLPAPLRVTAGTVVLQVSAPGHHPVERRIAVEAHATLREEVTLVPSTPVIEATPALPPAPPPTALPPPALPPTATLVTAPPAAPRRAVAPWVLVGAGGALLGGAAVLSALRAGAVDSLRARCGGADDPATAAVECAPDASARDLHDRAGLYRDLSITALAVGGAAALAGVIWIFAAPAQRRAVTVGATRHGPSLGWSF
ncbi:MAG: PEGA domain-containing protein [Deltaproteobacteria bacterium]|nr:PEGA domain-containing protein [Myxococcales bacterium]MDP3217063.1 PEGA domain-containing protein [Deltaproteobacteria bacterium]